eukprot:144936-Hanusia_phi.AAC.6
MSKSHIGMALEMTRCDCIDAIRNRVTNKDFENARFDEQAVTEVYSLFKERDLIPDEFQDIVCNQLHEVKKTSWSYEDLFHKIQFLADTLKEIHKIEFDIVYINRD